MMGKPKSLLPALPAGKGKQYREHGCQSAGHGAPGPQLREQERAAGHSGQERKAAPEHRPPSIPEGGGIFCNFLPNIFRFHSGKAASIRRGRRQRLSLLLLLKSQQLLSKGIDSMQSLLCLLCCGEASAHRLRVLPLLLGPLPDKLRSIYPPLILLGPLIVQGSLMVLQLPLLALVIGQLGRYFPLLPLPIGQRIQRILQLPLLLRQ